MSLRVMPEERIRDITRAAVLVFRRMGFQQAQMGEIAREAGVANGTLYNYFESKSHLFLYVMENGVPEEGPPMPSPEASSAHSEEDLLRMLKRELQEKGRLKCVDRFLKKRGRDIDIVAEISEIFREWWELMESNSIQIGLLEKSSIEFPQLKKVYDKYGRRYILEQLEKYLRARVKAGMIRKIHSIPGVARAMMEALGWFAWIQGEDDITPFCPKAEILPDLVGIFAHGLIAS